MPEAVFVCLDTSDYMRNGDFSPNRMSAAQESVSLLLSAKMQRNPENTIGFLTMGGKACSVKESLTLEMDNVMSSLASCEIGGSVCHFLNGLQIASLALSHRSNPRAEKRIIVFVSAPLKDSEKAVEKIAKKLRKDEVAVDVVGFGNEANGPIIEKFISVVNKNNNSHYLYIPEGSNLCDAVLSSVVTYGEENMPAAGEAGAGGGGGGGGGYEFGIDPNLDPELAMVLRLSLEEERRRQETVAGGAPATDGDAAPGPAVGAEGGSSSNATEGDAVPAPAQASEAAGGDGGDEMDELERALMLSLQEAEAEAQATAGGDAEGDAVPAKKEEQAKQEKEVDDAMEDPDFLAELQKEVDDALKKEEEEKK